MPGVPAHRVYALSHADWGVDLEKESLHEITTGIILSFRERPKSLNFVCPVHRETKNNA